MLVASAASAATIHVPGDHPTIQEGIDAAVPGDTVLVAPGVYATTDVRTLCPYFDFCRDVRAVAFLSPGVSLVSAGGPEVTTLTISEVDTLSQWLIVARDDVGQAAIDGFSLVGEGNTGGIFLEDADKAVRNCRFSRLAGQHWDQNGLAAGGGVRAERANLTIEDSAFDQCDAEGGGCAVDAYLGDGSSLSIERTSIESCTGRAIGAFGGSPPTGSIVIDASEFRWNEGPPVTANQLSGVVITNSVFLQNAEASRATVGGRLPPPAGGTGIIGNLFLYSGTSRGLSLTGRGATIAENLFVGAGLDLHPNATNHVVLRANVFTEHHDEEAFRGCLAQYNFFPSCNLFWNNSAGDYDGGNYCDELMLESSSFFLDPQHCNPAELDFTVAETSPCLPQNNPDGCDLIGPLGQGCGPAGAVVNAVLTTPAGLMVSGDGDVQVSPALFAWPPGETHSIGTDSLQIDQDSTTRWVFESWSDGGAAIHDIVIPSSYAEFVAEFRTEYYVETIAGTGGTVSPSEWVPAGDQIQVTAFPDPGYGFVRWVGSGAGSYTGMANPAVVAPAEPITQTAYFVQQEYFLEMVAGPGGSVTPESGLYDSLTPVEIRAIPDGRHGFDHWEGTGEGSYTGRDLVRTITMLGSIAQVASFQKLGARVALSLSATTPYEQVGELTGLSDVYLWYVCSDAEGLTHFEADVAGDLDVLAFVPSPGILSSGTPQRVVLTASECLEPPLVLGRFLVNSTGEGRLCLASGSTSQDVFALGCAADEPPRMSWPDFLRVTGVAVGGGSPCDFGNGCQDPFEGDQLEVAPGSSVTFHRGAGLRSTTPNPFRGSTELHIRLTQAARARLAVYDVGGRLVRTVVEADLPEGDHTAVWDGRDHAGRRVAGGTYFVRLRTDGGTLTRKVVFLGD